MKYLLIGLGIIILALLNYSAHADNPHSYTQPPYIQPSIYNSTTIQTDGKAIAFSQAGANNHISATTFKPQLSLGIGNYEDDFAASVMYGQKACKDCLLFSGSFAFDSDFEETAIGFGMAITIK